MEHEESFSDFLSVSQRFPPFFNCVDPYPQSCVTRIQFGFIATAPTAPVSHVSASEEYFPFVMIKAYNSNIHESENLSSK